MGAFLFIMYSIFHDGNFEIFVIIDHLLFEYHQSRNNQVSKLGERVSVNDLKKINRPRPTVEGFLNRTI